MTFYSVEDLKVYQKSKVAADAISAMVQRRAFFGDLKLRGQLRDASGRIPPNIAEGHAQKSDKHFAHFLYIALGSARETRGHLHVAKGRGLVTEDERQRHDALFEELAKMLTKLIRHLEKEDRKNRWGPRDFATDD